MTRFVVDQPGGYYKCIYLCILILDWVDGIDSTQLTGGSQDGSTRVGAAGLELAENAHEILAVENGDEDDESE